MKLNLLVSRPGFEGAGEAVHVDPFDLYWQRPQGTFIKQAAVELGVKEDVIKHDLGKLLLKCEALQSERIRARHCSANPEMGACNASSINKDQSSRMDSKSERAVKRLNGSASVLLTVNNPTETVMAKGLRRRS
jgi:hypothetical protein